MLGLLIIAFGTGGIKPCVSAFGGDQFVRPQQDKQLEQFFSVFYFSINAGSLLSTFLTPILREDVQCFGDDSCYSLAFGVPAILMLIAVGKIPYKNSEVSNTYLLSLSYLCHRQTVVQDQKARRKHFRRFCKVHWCKYFT